MFEQNDNFKEIYRSSRHLSETNKKEMLPGKFKKRLVYVWEHLKRDDGTILNFQIPTLQNLT